MRNVLKFPQIRKRLLLTLLVIVVFRLFAHVPVPGVDIAAIKAFIQNNALLGLFDLFSGGGFQNFSLVTLGLAPYINVSIIIQIFTVMIPSLEELSKEGEYGREKINMYTRYLTVPMALIQSYGIYFLLIKQNVIGSLVPFDLLLLMTSLTAGTMALVWVGELVTEYGVGNGISLLIFVSIVSRLPFYLAGFAANINSYSVMNIMIFLALTLLVIAGVVLVNEGTRNITLEYGRMGVTSRKVTNYLPIKVNQAGVIPIIFAVSVVLIPAAVSGPLQASANGFLQNAGYFLAQNFSSTSFLYNLLYFLLVVGFTYFYTTFQFNPEKVADDIKKRGGFIPGIRPGRSTTRYLKDIVNRITLSGGLFLGVIAVLPYIVQTYLGNATFAVGGTGLLIVVSVVLETVRQIESLTLTQSYETYLR